MLNKLQKPFVEDAIEHLQRGTGLLSLSAPAGTGKSFCISKILDHVGDAIVLCPSHKACKVIKKQSPNHELVMTVTSFTKDFKGTIGEVLEEARRYDNSLELLRRIAEVKSSGKWLDPIFKEKSGDSGDGFSVILDESSMISADDFAEICVKADRVLAVGDHFQLLPVKGKSWFHTINHDHAFSEVMRSDNDVINIATKLRDNWGKKFDISELPKFVGTKQNFATLAKSNGVILAWQNKVVDLMARKSRAALGKQEDFIDPDETLIALNNFGDINNKDEFVVRKKSYIYDAECYGCDLLSLPHKTETHAMINPVHLLGDRDKSRLSNEGVRLRYNYSSTIHSSQGSEWDFSVVTNDFDKLDVDSFNRMLYVAVTRAKKKCFVI
jgi:superfamily I DNA/RNA helicase